MQFIDVNMKGKNMTITMHAQIITENTVFIHD